MVAVEGELASTEPSQGVPKIKGSQLAPSGGPLEFWLIPLRDWHPASRRHPCFHWFH